ncbi:hypothetical protein [Halorussus halophilus]|uniref:hypothetical protein n=1 Tax=Halorussus halophilus TaxID=2650975 RepID=UPI00130170D1|nr:hypothetical protein [Halorussus halophilus]
MHLVIYALVDASTEDEALAAGKSAFTHLVGTGYAPFDYYVTFDQEGTTVAGKARWGDLPTAAKLDSPAGKELLEEAWTATEREFERNLEKIKDGLADHDDEEIMQDTDLVRYACYALGAYRGSSVRMYTEVGDGIRDAVHLENVVERLETPWIVPADVHY